MLTIIIILIIVASLMLTLLVLIQNPKGGIAANFVAPSQIMGVKRSTDIVEKATWVMAIALISLSLLSNFFRPEAGTSTGNNESRIKSGIESQSVPAPAPMPAPAQTGQPAQGQPQGGEQPAGAQQANP